MFIIIDEAQNLTPQEVGTNITRAGEGTKIVLTGDISQIDQPYLDSQSNGLSQLISRMKGSRFMPTLLWKKENVLGWLTWLPSYFDRRPLRDLGVV